MGSITRILPVRGNRAESLQRQLIEALIVARLALDHIDTVPGNIVELVRAKELAEAAIQAGIHDVLHRSLLRAGEDNEEEVERDS